MDLSSKYSLLSFAVNIDDNDVSVVDISVSSETIDEATPGASTITATLSAATYVAFYLPLLFRFDTKCFIDT